MIECNVLFSFPFWYVRNSLELNLSSRLECILTHLFHMSFIHNGLSFFTGQYLDWRLRCLHFICVKWSLYSEAKGKI